MACCASVSRAAGVCMPSASGSVTTSSSQRRGCSLRFPLVKKVSSLSFAAAVSHNQGFRLKLATGGSFSSVARAAKREDELKEIRELSDDEIKSNVQDLKGELFILRAMQATRQEFKCSEFGRIRKRIARMLTVRRERELDQGVNKRQSRKVDRAWQKSIVYRPPPSYVAKLKEQEAKKQS